MAERTDWGHGWLRIREMFRMASDYYATWDHDYHDGIAAWLRVNVTR